MKQFNMGKVIQQKRKESQLTQEELAQKMGVSKSSVSKWETGQTYPDIYLLPELATFFSITIDELMDYEPHLSKEEVRNIYIELSERFGNDSFEVVFEELKQLIEKYYASDFFLAQMATLLLNYANFAAIDKQKELLLFIIELVQRVKEITIEAALMTQSNALEAFCQLQLGNSDEALSLLNHDVALYMGQEQILSQAYIAKGNFEKAQEVLQVTQYQHLIGLIVTSGDELALEVENLEKFDEIVCRIKRIIEVYDVRNLHPFLVITFLNNVFIGLTQQFRIEEGLKILTEIVDMIIAQTFPIELHGDDYFYLLDDWMLNQPNLNTNMPRDEKTIKMSLIDFYETHPGIRAAFIDNQQFNSLIKKLKENNGDA